MGLRVVVLESAEQDVMHLRAYIVKNFGAALWRQTYRKIKDGINRLADFPREGGVPDELRRQHVNEFRQVLSGKNRIIYSADDEAVYIHIICDSRMDLSTLLSNRLVR